MIHSLLFYKFISNLIILSQHSLYLDHKEYYFINFKFGYYLYCIKKVCNELFHNLPIYDFMIYNTNNAFLYIYEFLFNISNYLIS